jgi:uncharacterized protein
MSVLDLRKLWQLHQIDTAILEIRKRAAALDPGRAIQKEIDRLTGERDQAAEAAKALGGELQDRELQQKSIDDKLKRIDKELYGGKVVNPREVEALQKEIEALKRQRGDHDVRILELWELTPPAKAKVEELDARLDTKKKELAEYQKKVLQAKAKLEQDYKATVVKRDPAAKEVPAPLLSRYEMIRQKHGGTGMAEITRTSSCGVCGMMLPEKLIEGAREGRTVTCEACHRILYKPEGLL